MASLHKRKLDKFTTVMISSRSNRAIKTLHIPKWVKYPITATLLVAVFTVGTLTYNHINYVKTLESERSLADNKIDTLNQEIETRDATISDLELTAVEQEEMLKQVDQQAEVVASKLEKLLEDTSNFEERLGTTTKTTESKPISLNRVPKASSTLAFADDGAATLKTSALNADINEEVVSELSFHDRSKSIFADYQLFEEVLDAQLGEMTSLNEQADILIPYWDSYPSGWPTNGRITSGYGWRQNPTGPGTQFHKGLDIANYTGAKLVATGAGTVVESRYSSSYGYVIKINHGYGYSTLYAHNSKNLVRVGDRVERGDLIGYIGSTGNSTGPHSHYEVRYNNVPKNPVNYLY